MHDSDFRTVKNKNNRRKCYLIAKESSSLSSAEELGEKLRLRLIDIETEITCEQFYTELIHILRQRAINRVICLGLGHFSTCSTARVQLAFLLALRRSLKNLTDIQLQDPAFTCQETVFLQSLDFKVLLDNLEGRFSTDPDHQVLYYLPHCPKALTHNLLATNWTRDQLERSVVVCNSFEAVLTNTLERDIPTEAKYVQRIKDYTTEIRLRVSERNFDSFNDTSLHLFASSDLDRITDPAFWTVDEDIVPEADPEFIAKKLEDSLNIS